MAPVQETPGRPTVGVTVEIGAGAGAYNTRCTTWPWATNGGESFYAQTDLVAQVVVAVHRQYDLFFGGSVGFGTMQVPGLGTESVGYLGADTGFRVYLPHHLATAIVASFHTASAVNVYLTDANVAQLSIALLWSVPPKHEPAQAPPSAAPSSESPQPANEIAPPGMPSNPQPSTELPPIEINGGQPENPRSP